MFEALRTEVTGLLAMSNKQVSWRLQAICDLLKESVAYYDWVGFILKMAIKEELKTGPYAGAPTDHTIIPLEKAFVGR